MIIRKYGQDLIAKIKKVEIEGDSFAWDVWYIDENNEYYQDIMVEEIEVNKNIEKLKQQIGELESNELYFKFKYVIDIGG